MPHQGITTFMGPGDGGDRTPQGQEWFVDLHQLGAVNSTGPLWIRGNVNEIGNGDGTINQGRLNAYAAAIETYYNQEFQHIYPILTESFDSLSHFAQTLSVFVSRTYAYCDGYIIYNEPNDGALPNDYSFATAKLHPFDYTQLLLSCRSEIASRGRKTIMAGMLWPVALHGADGASERLLPYLAALRVFLAGATPYDAVNLHVHDWQYTSTDMTDLRNDSYAALGNPNVPLFIGEYGTTRDSFNTGFLVQSFANIRSFLAYGANDAMFYFQHPNQELSGQSDPYACDLATYGLMRWDQSTGYFIPRTEAVNAYTGHCPSFGVLRQAFRQFS